MKNVKTALFHAIVQIGIYWGALEGIDFVSNLTAVGMSLYSLVAIVVAAIAHFVFSVDDNPSSLASSLKRHSTEGVLKWLFRVSGYAQAVALIAIGGAWIALGTLWLIAVILLDMLVMRAQGLDTSAV